MTDSGDPVRQALEGNTHGQRQGVHHLTAANLLQLKDKLEARALMPLPY